MLWSPAFFGVKPDLIIKGGSIVAAPMGDPNASIPTPAAGALSPDVRSVRPLAHRLVGRLRLEGRGRGGDRPASSAFRKQLVAVQGTRKISKKNMIHNDATPEIKVDPETYEVTADGELLTCEPAQVLPMAQRYFLF